MPAKEEDLYIELGRGLVAAVVSVHMRISLDHCYRTQFRDRPVDAGWVKLAREIYQGHLENFTRRLFGRDEDRSSKPPGRAH
jgi:hypothetical protein